MKRRKFVGLLGVAAAAGVTGCTGSGNGDGGSDGENGGGGDNGSDDGTEEADNNGDGGGGDDGDTDEDTTDLTGQEEVEVDVGAGSSGFQFDPADIAVDAGTTVRWVWTGSGGSHDVTHADGEEPYEPGGEQEVPIKRDAGGENPLFKSELVGDEGHEFTYTFEEAGTYDYVCTVHVTQGMAGSVEVQ